MRYSVVFLVLAGFLSCKNNGAGTKSSKGAENAQSANVEVKQIIVDANRGPAPKPDFSASNWTMKRGILEVVVQYSGGCDEHDFNAYFSGSWLKSMPPQAMVTLEHLNPKNDPCRKMVKDTFLFDATPLEYPGGEEVMVKLASDPSMMAKLRYGKEDRK